MKENVTWNGKVYPVRIINLPEEFGYNNPVTVADGNLFKAYAASYEKGDKDAEALNDSLFMILDCGFIEKDPTDEEIIERMIAQGL